MPSKKSNTDRGPTALPKYRGTGFEEYYADPPMTPAEAKDERENIYNPTIPFVERIQACIQRFRCRRRINTSDSIQLFNQYLFLGGIDTSPRLFGGNDEADMVGMTPEERRNATAIDTVYNSGGGSRFYNADEPSGWEIDFAGVVAGFCSETLPAMTNWEYPRMGKAIGLIENFLSYVLHHDVCPEYDDNIKEALAVCNRAKIDLPLTHQALIRFPGQFNLALSELFCEDFNFFADDEAGFQRPRNFSPAAVVELAMAVGMLGMGVDEKTGTSMIHAARNPQTLKVISEEDCNMEIVSIIRASHSLRQVIRTVTIEGSMPDGFAALGKLVLQPCVVEDGYDHGYARDCNSNNHKSNAGGGSGGQDAQVFLIDDSILARLRPGFKLQLRVVRLDNGVSFIQQARAVLVSWHTFLPQTLMVHFKEPVANDRPAPCVTNPDDGEDDKSPEKNSTD
ncbi:argonaute sirna chaperone complex subunit arb1 [Colletotrichum truncatum]|uniref:Argonaute sirna chaperone complex subunit arb1 n=1 Tax=Colletotrichum truncatum TaxID=5467 RepID=A0ACC3YEX9_COLTU|nr:argonaute sirna chaperone complex subunit arb1 [Colletotrichum truncatum]KAF6784924.1 argonaute sirna chaperone complex subunit arb1 [Colletotrichum truncatum]